ncbi:MAG: hypothetical protein JO219_09415 [Candidatus Eremiobacteraeota bacterium]|nr:hypothetical protein [Candidatus Eremiobacteraeota bacterium]
MHRPPWWHTAVAVRSSINRIPLSVLGGLLCSVLLTGPSAAGSGLTWKLANPSTIVAYQVGKGVITVASVSIVSCDQVTLQATSTPFVYNFEVGTPKGVLCDVANAAPIAAYYQAGSPSKVTVNTKAGPKTIDVTLPPPQPASIGHLPFH